MGTSGRDDTWEADALDHGRQPFAGARERIRRARAHRATIAKAWNRFIENDPFQTSVRVSPDGTGRVALGPTPLPEGLALDIGELLYQLRSALNSVVYDAAILETGKDPPPGAHLLEFPICENKGQFDAAARKLGPLAPERRALVELLQPYNQPDHLEPHELPYNFNRGLAILNEWSRIDRHRRLHVVGAWASGASPKVLLPEAAQVKAWRIPEAPFFLEARQETEVAEFEIDGWHPGMQAASEPGCDHRSWSR